MKHLAVFALVLVLSVSLLLGTAVSLFDAQDNVEVRETCMGDRSALQGLTVTFHSTANIIGWDTAFTFGEGAAEPRSDFTYKPKYSYRNLSPSFDMELWSPVFSTESSSTVAGLSLAYNNSNDRYDRKVNEVVGRTNPGEIRSEVFYLADIVDLLPWELDSSYGFYSGGDNARQRNDLADLFRVRVPEDEMVEITVKKSVGRLSVYSHYVEEYHEPLVRPVSDDREASAPANGSLTSPTVRAFGDAGEAGVWVYPTVLDRDGGNVVEYRDGQGLYFIPRAVGDLAEQIPSSELFAVEYGGLLPKRGRLLYPTDETPVGLHLSSDEKHVQLFTKVDGMLWLTVLDASDGTLIDRMEVMPFDGDGFLYEREKGTRFLACDKAGGLFVAEERDGSAAPVLTTAIDLDTSLDGRYFVSDLFRNSDYTDFAFDGTRLAVADGSDQILMTADESGITCVARLEYSPVWNGTTGDHYVSSAHPTFWDVAMEVSFDGED